MAGVLIFGSKCSTLPRIIASRHCLRQLNLCERKEVVRQSCTLYRSYCSFSFGSSRPGQRLCSRARPVCCGQCGHYSSCHQRRSLSVLQAYRSLAFYQELAMLQRCCRCVVASLLLSKHSLSVSVKASEVSRHQGKNTE